MTDEESPNFFKKNNDLFFEELRNSGFFPQSPEIISIQKTVNPGNEQEIQIPNISGSQQQSSIITEDLEQQQNTVVEQQQQSRQPEIQAPETPTSQQQSNIAVQELESVEPQQKQSNIVVQAPETSTSQQQSNIAVQELEPIEPQQQQQSRQPEIQAPEATGTQQQSGIAVQELEPVQSEPTSTKELQALSPLFVNQNKTASLSTAENNISDLDQKSKLEKRNEKFNLSAKMSCFRILVSA
jgi:hypothetical protein